jgi:Family of unknown function (DUF5947)
VSPQAGQRAELVTALRRLRTAGPAGAPAAAPSERCELCRAQIPDDHRHLLHLEERRIVCVCPTCWSLRSGDPEFRPTGARTLFLDDLVVPEDVWARFSIPIGLAFFMRSSTAGGVVAMYPSPAGPTECELPLDAWDDLAALNPLLADLEPDAEGLIVNRLGEPHQHVLAPIDACYGLVGVVKASWEGISGGPDLTGAVAAYLEGLRPGVGR